MVTSKVYYLPKGTEPTDEVVNNLISSTQREKNMQNYEALYGYYMSMPVTERPAPHDIRVVVGHARYITKINVGYLLGNPVQYLASEGVDIEPLDLLYRNQTISTLDVELATDASIFGHAFERVYTDKEGNSRSAKIDPRNIILAYDDTVEHNKLFAIIYTQSYRADGTEIKGQYECTILTDTMIKERVLKNKTLVASDDDEDIEHSYGEVPVIEYVNSSDRMGDFEPVVSLIDAYNILQSDRVIDRERLVDAFLMVSGASFTPEQQKALKEGRIVSGIPADAEMKYIIKNINEADADVLRETLMADIHKISMTPDMSDKNFLGNSSGVALLFKLLPFEDHIKDKERYFENGLMDRFRMYNRILAAIGKMQIVKPADIDATFKRALPQNDLEISQMINNLVGIVDRETLVSRLSFVQDAKETVELANKEDDEDLELGNYGTDKPDNHSEDHKTSTFEDKE